MVNGPLDFLFRSPNSKSNSNTDFLVHGWRLPHFDRGSDRRESDGNPGYPQYGEDGTWVYGIRRTPGLRDRARGGWRSTIGGPHGPEGVSPVSDTTTSTTTETTWKWHPIVPTRNHKDDPGPAIVKFIREHSLMTFRFQFL